MQVGLAVESMRRHTTDEGWQLFAGLESAGYRLCGYGLDGLTDVQEILLRYNPDTVVVQDKREWEGKTAGSGFDVRERFSNVCTLREHSSFKLTVLKDAHSLQDYHKQSAEEIGCDAWIVYYDPDTVCKLAPFVPRKRVIRTYHSLDRYCVPQFNKDRAGCVLSGAVSGAYPLRQKLVRSLSVLPETAFLKHPGYRRDGCRTPDYMCELSKYKVAICTASRYQFALRKIMEATAAGCMVITDLQEQLPHIDSNLYRVPQDATPRMVASLIRKLLQTYDCSKQDELAYTCSLMYDYRVLCKQLANDIERMRNVLRSNRTDVSQRQHKLPQ